MPSRSPRALAGPIPSAAQLEPHSVAGGQQLDFPPDPAEHHCLTVDRSLGALHLQADLRLSAPWTLIFGPSGGGKTSLLRAACGLLGNAGIRFSRREPPGFDLPLISRHRTVPVHQLGLAYAPQQGALFPHLSVRDNIAFAIRASSERIAAQAHDVEARLGAIIDLLELAPLLPRRPQSLSGGERQRVNLARALAVPAARLVLLDEPFTGIGRSQRDRLLPQLQAFIAAQKIPVLSVSHDVDEALLLRAEVVVLDGGRVIARGPAAPTLAGERERLLATLATADTTPVPATEEPPAPAPA